MAKTQGMNNSAISLFETARVLDGNLYYIPSAEARREEIAKNLTIQFQDYLDRPCKIYLFSVAPKWVVVPRFYGFERYGPPVKKRQTRGVEIADYALKKIDYKLYPAQQLCVDALFDRYLNEEKIQRGEAGCTLNLACGKGKTHIGIHSIALLRRRTLIVCHSCVSVSQWRKHLLRSLPFVATVEFHGGHSLPLADVVISTVHPLAFARTSNAFDGGVLAQWLGNFGHVIYDEIHLFGADRFREIFNLVFSATQLGLSATPERSDGNELEYSLKVGPILNAQSDLGICPPQFKVVVFPISPPTSRRPLNGASYAEKVKALTMDEGRVEFLIGKMREHLNNLPDENQLIFCNYIQEVDFLFDRLSAAFPSLTGEGGNAIGKVYRDLCSEAIAALADTARIIICTYKKGGTAFSPLRFTTVWIWSPTRQIEQPIGRIQRWRDEEGLDEGTSWNDRVRYVFDFIDPHSPAASQYYSDHRQNDKVMPGRRKTYKTAGYTIREVHREKSLKALEEKAARLSLVCGGRR